MGTRNRNVYFLRSFCHSMDARMVSRLFSRYLCSGNNARALLGIVFCCVFASIEQQAKTLSDQFSCRFRASWSAVIATTMQANKIQRKASSTFVNL